mgnify:CR=1 FL=1
MKRFIHAALLLAMSAVAQAQTTRPIVIAHRGASGYLPEHTLEAKALAHAMGADFLEQDVVLTKDDVPIVMHDIHLETISDVAKVFANRHRKDGHYYAIDFTFAEIKQLRANERISTKTGKAVYPKRFPLGASSFQIPSLEEELQFIQGLNKSTGRIAGIYPEIKQPAFHRKEGHDISAIVLPMLRKYGYATKNDPCWLQCFEFDEVKRFRDELKWEGGIVFLMGMFMDQVSMMLITLPIFMPLAASLNLDKVWFGLILLLLFEVGFTTPPFGMLLFIMLGIAPKGTTLKTVSLAAAPYIACTMLLIGLIIVLPCIALWLPRML